MLVTWFVLKYSIATGNNKKTTKFTIQSFVVASNCKCDDLNFLVLYHPWRVCLYHHIFTKRISVSCFHRIRLPLKFYRLPCEARGFFLFQRNYTEIKVCMNILHMGTINEHLVSFRERYFPDHFIRQSNR